MAAGLFSGSAAPAIAGNATAVTPAVSGHDANNVVLPIVAIRTVLKEGWIIGIASDAIVGDFDHVAA